MPVKDKVKSFNFEFIINTKLEKYYNTLVEDELALYRSPTNEKIYIDSKRIIEDLVGDLLLKDLNEDGIYNDLVDNIEILYRKAVIPEDISYKFNRIRKAANNFAHPNSESIDTPEYILILLRECLKWYLNHFKIKTLNEYGEFKKPNYSEIENYEKIYKDIVKKYNKLKKNYYKDLKEKETRFINLNNEKILKDNKKILEVRKLIRIYSLKEEEVKKEISDLENSIFFLMNLVKDLKNNESINILNKRVKNSKKKVLEIKEKENLLVEKIRLLEDKVLDGVDINDYIETSDNISYEILNEIREEKELVRKTSKEILEIKEIEEKEEGFFENLKYKEFFDGFLKLEGENLRTLYIFLKELDFKTILKFKLNGKIKKNNIKKIEKFIYKEELKINSLSDEEIKLKLYYLIIKQLNIDPKDINNLDSFKENSDLILDEIILNLEKKKDFNLNENKVKSIVVYFLNKINTNLNKIFLKGKAEEKEEIIDFIFNRLEELQENLKEEVLDFLEIANPNEAKIKSNLRKNGVLNLLKSFINIGGVSLYLTYGSIVYNILKNLKFEFSFTIYPGGEYFIGYLISKYLIRILIDEGWFSFKNKNKEIISIIITLSIVISYINKNSNEDNYFKLKKEWNKKISYFNYLKNKLDEIIKEKEEKEKLKENLEKKILVHNNIIKDKKNNLEKYKKEIKYDILNSYKLSLLEGYSNYSENLNKIRNLKIARNYNKNKKTLNKISFLIKNEIKIKLLEKEIKKERNNFINLAIKNPNFKEETKHLRIILKEISLEKEKIEEIKEEIKKEKEDYNNILEKEKKLIKNMDSTKKEYFNIDLVENNI